MNGGDVYIVTGASAGIGRAVSLALAKRGLRVLAVARSADLLEDLGSEAGDLVAPLVADLATADGVNAVEGAIDGDVAGVVHGAASLIDLEPYGVMDAVRLVEHFRIHVAAPVALYQALAAGHSLRRMLFIDSYSASTPRVGWPAYSIIKAGAQMAARTAAAELADTEVIRVFPGAVNTQVLQAVLDSNTPSAAVYGEMVARGEVAQPADAAAFMTTLLVDVPDAELRTREVWDYNNPQDRALVG